MNTHTVVTTNSRKKSNNEKKTQMQWIQIPRNEMMMNEKKQPFKSFENE